MKKILFFAVAMIVSVTALFAEERVIDSKSLPKSAKELISKYYPKDKISIATEERGMLERDYKVILTNGVKLEFDKNGNWTEIECKRNSKVPMEIVPDYIVKYVKARFPKNTIVKIERDSKKTDVELNNDIELTFNSKGKLIEIDN